MKYPKTYVVKDFGNRKYIPISGLTNIRTLRSASSASTISPACMSSGLTSAYFHTQVVDWGFGRGGTILAISVHNGARCLLGREERKVVWVVDAILTCSDGRTVLSIVKLLQ
jgi:hypothetical protein